MITLKGIDDYIKDITHPDVNVRRHAVFQLKYFGPEAAGHLRAITRKDPDPLVRISAISSLGWIGDDDCDGDILTILLEGDEVCAEEAAAIVGERCFETAREPLLNAARDPVHPNREYILRALGAFPGGGVEEELMRILCETDYIEEAIACAESLAELQYYRAAPEIIRLYHENDDDMVMDDLMSCMAALLGEPQLAVETGYHEVDMFIDSIIEGLMTEGEEKKEAILNALKKKDPRRFGKLIKESILRITQSIFINAGIWDESTQNISEEELLDRLVDTRIGACVNFIEYLARKDNSTRGKYRFASKQRFRLMVCAVFPALRELNKVMLKSAGKQDTVVDLVGELAVRCTVSPHRLIKEAAGYGEQAVPPLIEYLDEAQDGMSGWCLAEALGRIGTPAAVKGLLETFYGLSEEDEDEGFVYSIQEALARCGETAVDRIIEFIQDWDKSEEDYEEEDNEEGDNDGWEESSDDDEEGLKDYWPGIFACGALAKIRHPKAFEFLLSRLAHTDSDVRRTTLEQLLEYGDPEAIFVVRRMLDDDDDDVVHAAKATLVGLCDANGVKLGDLDKLRAELAEEDDFAFDGEYYDDPEDEDWFWDDYPDSDECENIEKDDTYYNKKLVPVVKPPKIGRNDPCPCGSGKKYKRCCLEKQ